MHTGKCIRGFWSDQNCISYTSDHYNVTKHSNNIPNVLYKSSRYQFSTSIHSSAQKRPNRKSEIAATASVVRLGMNLRIQSSTMRLTLEIKLNSHSQVSPSSPAASGSQTRGQNTKSLPFPSQLLPRSTASLNH